MKELKVYVLSDGGKFMQGEEEQRDVYCENHNVTYTVWIYIFDKGIPIKSYKL